ncbi:hypothetical protein RhiXN_02851 [Rhizoctonia solani]|uniref:Mediator complex subunit 19 n=1 Tax=Rhizoctonia solani TaxID=456999 RepID=A0A8H8NTH0_9AGAM|nr:uncharacterized protein RhiXN_02851 [Rhizoctonia solani]QRW17927.1 hypothetical protein RhiXN_02851 [Rhizoctonia solani]
MTQPNAVAGPSHTGQSLAHSDASIGTGTALTGGIGSLSLDAYLPPAPGVLPPLHRHLPSRILKLFMLYNSTISTAHDNTPHTRPTGKIWDTAKDKGKRKEDEADESRHGPKEGLFQHGYKAFIKDLGLGKHNHKKDTFLTDLMQMPEKQPVQVVKLDRTTLVHAFRLKEGGVPGFNTSALTGDDKERKKKKKKRPIDPSQPSAPATPAAAGSAAPSAAAPIRRPAGPLPPSQLASSHVPPAQQSSQRPPQQQPPPQRHPLPANPKAAATAVRPSGAGTASGTGTIKRKDREDSVNGHVGSMGGGNMGPTGGTGLKPAKKRKMDPMAFAPGHHHHAQPVQQPTPHY